MPLQDYKAQYSVKINIYIYIYFLSLIYFFFMEESDCASHCAEIQSSSLSSIMASFICVHPPQKKEIKKEKGPLKGKGKSLLTHLALRGTNLTGKKDGVGERGVQSSESRHKK